MRRVLVAVRRLLLVAALLALVTGFLDRPAPAPSRLPELRVTVAVDRTTSMSALDDPSGSRITAVRRDLVQLADLLDGASLSLVTFGQDVTEALPSTTDRVAFDDAVRTLQVEEPASGTGTSVGRPVAFLTSELPPPASARTETATGPEEVPVLVLVTDGENTSPDPQPSFAPLGREIGAGVVLGYGTEAGGVMPLERVPVGDAPPPASAPGPVVPAGDSGEPAVSKLDTANLTTIAGELGVGYVHADGEQSMAAVAAALQAAAYADLPPVDPERELRWVWALLALLLALPELRAGWRTLLESVREGRR